jgi:hypothetical protein
MLATRVLSTYRCVKCNIPYVFNFNLMEDVVKVADNLDKHKQCAICERKLQLVKVVFKIARDDYGDIGFGSWRCPTHSQFTYYPGQLKKTVNCSLREIEVGGVTHYIRYVNVIAAGRPWKCPMCGQRLIYIDERHQRAY